MSAPSSRASPRPIQVGSTAALRRICSFTRRSTSRSCARGVAADAGKSKRRPSGPTQLPACLACSPSTSRSARCSRWVAVWLRAAAHRRRSSTRASTGSPTSSCALQPADVHDRVTHALRVLHHQPALRAQQLTLVADLAAALRVERAAVQHDLGRLRLAGNAEHGQPIGPRLVRIPDELARQRGERRIGGEACALAAARPLALLGHGPVEPLAVDRHVALRRDLDGEVDREAEGVVQAKRLIARDEAIAAGRLDQRQQLLRARLQGARELAPPPPRPRPGSGRAARPAPDRPRP